MTKDDLKRELNKDIKGLAMVAFGILTFVCLMITSISSQSEEAIGALGRFLVRCMLGLFGSGKYIFAILIIFWGIQIIKKVPREKLNSLIPATAIFFFIFLALMHLPIVKDSVGFTEMMRQSLSGEGGGLVGALIAWVLFWFFGRVGSYFVLLFAAAASLILLGIPTFKHKSIGNAQGKIAQVFSKCKQKLIDFLFVEVEVEDDGEEGDNQPPVIVDHRQSPVIVDHRQSQMSPGKVPGSGESAAKQLRFDLHELEFDEDDSDMEIYDSVYGSSRGLKDGLNDGLQQLHQGLQAGLQGEPNRDKEFQLPPLDLLQKPIQLKKSRIDKDITDTVKLLEQTLASFGVEVKVTQVSCGPAITRYELQPAKGVKVSRIVSLADDIALSLAAPQVRIEAPIPGKAALGIEVPNSEVSKVFFREVLESKEFSGSKHSLAVALGKDIAGSTVIANLRDMPHLLVAGATGSGKSVCMNTLIASLLFRNTPEDLKLMLIDPKMVELTDFNGIPHLICPVVTEPKKAATALRWMVREMEKRYEDFAKNGVRDIHRFNDLAAKREDLEKLPFIVVLIDELADLMMVAPTDVEDCICRLAQMARAAGIHLVVATQRPSVDVITGLIKANIPSRIAFAVSSQTDSRTILDAGGAEKLLGKGDMLFHPVGAAKPVRIQGAYISDNEVDSLVRFLKTQEAPEYEDDLLKSQEESPSEVEEVEDELLPKALSLCLEQGHASISLLQRRLHIGYTRAARLIDIMEAKGFIGPYEGSKPRAILSGWEEYQSRNEEELD